MSDVAATRFVTALTIAGSDSSGGAGVQADLRAFASLGVHGASVVTLITAQGTRGVRKVETLRAELVRAQLHAVLEDMSPRAVKTGALGTAGCVEIVADEMRARPEGRRLLLELLHGATETLPRVRGRRERPAARAAPAAAG